MKKIMSVLFAVCLLFGFATVAQAKDAVTVTVCVYEFVNNQYIAEPKTITDDRIDNAFDALQMLEGFTLSTDGNGNINTLNEFRQDVNGGERCWIYRVNGKKLDVSPASYLVQDGDKIEIIYITKLSDIKKTLPQPVPTTIPTTPAPTTTPTTV
ncbi:MAG: DUF4430 domain-containing protein, partial [Peptococcaceae bacterium]|nr:DUF4430 domain-containing protein [Peptococcaceae bacterium]